MNGTSNSSIVTTNQNVIIVQLFFYCSITCIGATGNILICLAILRRRQHKISEYFIFNLSVTDLAVCTVSIPLDVAERILGYWPYGTVFCKIIYPFQTILMAVSVSTLLAMSLERYRVIIHPFKPRIKVHSSRTIIAGIWGGSIILVSPYIYVLSHDGEKCIEKWPSDITFVQAYTMSVFIVLYLCPLFIITVAYSLVGAKLYRDIKRMKGIFAVENKTTAGKRMLKSRAHRNLRIVKIFIAAVCAFAVCFLPTHVMWVWHDFGSGSKSSDFTNLLVFANILVYFNSCINPFIFGTLQTQCSSFKTLFKRAESIHTRRFSIYSLRMSFNSSLHSNIHSHIHSLRGRRSSSKRGPLFNSRLLLYSTDQVKRSRDWEHLALESNM